MEEAFWRYGFLRGGDYFDHKIDKQGVMNLIRAGEDFEKANNKEERLIAVRKMTLAAVSPQGKHAFSDIKFVRVFIAKMKEFSSVPEGQILVTHVLMMMVYALKGKHLSVAKL